MKPFKSYQYLEGTEMTERDKLEVGSKFWNEGKWKNFVEPFLREEIDDRIEGSDEIVFEKIPIREMTFVDIGCNAGLFLKLAEDKGFGKVIGVDFDEEAIKKGLAWRDKQGKKYRMLHTRMEDCIDKLPIADYTILANTHYYFTINDWLDYLDKLQYRTRFCVIVTAEKRAKQLCWASTEVSDIRGYFKAWNEVGFVDTLPLEGDPMPRKLWGMCFKSLFIERVSIDSISSRNTQQHGFYSDVDKGIPYDKTEYWKFHKAY